MPVVSRDPSDAWIEKFLKRVEGELRRKDDLSQKETKSKQQTDEQEHHNEEGHAE